MICCLSITAVLLLAGGGGALALWTGVLTDMEIKYSGPLMILGLILSLAGLVLITFSVELCLRLRKQIKRVMDPSLLKTSNFHEVKHWIEPGIIFRYGSINIINIILSSIDRIDFFRMGPV